MTSHQHHQQREQTTVTSHRTTPTNLDETHSESKAGFPANLNLDSVKSHTGLSIDKLGNWAATHTHTHV